LLIRLELSVENFVTCTSCDDFDLCLSCHVGLEHGHHPKHAFAPAVEDSHLATIAQKLLAPGRNVGHDAVCDGCDKVCKLEDLEIWMLTNYSTSMVFVTSALTAQTGTSALPACQMPALSTPTIDSFQFTNPSPTPLLWPNHTTANLATTVSTAMVLFATAAMATRLSLEVIDTSVPSAMTPTSVPTVRLAHQTATTELTL